MDQDPQEHTLDFKSLQAKFQEEGPPKQLMNKPAVPHKPKVLPLPGSRTSLLSSINIAVENKMHVIPRVVFKNDKEDVNNKQMQSTPTPLKVKNEPTLSTAVHVQKKEGDIMKKALQDRELPVLQPISVMEEKSRPKPDPLSPAQSPPPRQWDAVPPPKFTKTSSIENAFSPKTEHSLNLSSTSEPRVTTMAQLSAQDSKLGGVNILAEKSEPSELQSPSLYIQTPSSPPGKASLPLEPTKISSPEKEFSRSTKGSFKPTSTSEAPARTLAQIGAEVPKVKNGNFSREISPPSVWQSAAKPTCAEGRCESVQQVFKTPPCDRRVLKALEKAKQKVSFKNAPPDEDPANTVKLNTLHPELPPTDYDNAGAKGRHRQLPNVPLVPDVSPPPAPEINGPSYKLKSPSSAKTAGSRLEAEVLLPPPRGPLADSAGPSPQTSVKPPAPSLSSRPNLEAEADAGIEPELGNLILHEQLDAALLKAPEGFDKPEFPELRTRDLEAVEHKDRLVTRDGAVEHYTANHGLVEHMEAPHHPSDAVVGGKVAEAEAAGAAVVLPVADTQPGAWQQQKPSPSSDKGTKAHKGQKKHKLSLKNPYADTKAARETSPKGSRLLGSKHDKSERKGSPEGPSDKELKKKEKQRLEKEKKEQKERQKKENEMKKKFKLTGQEEVMYQAKVSVASKGRKNELPVKIGETISIIRTTNCPKGMWLARDSGHKYGYVPVKSVELDVKEMVELGMKASQPKGRTSVDGEVASTGSRNSSHYPLSADSFTDDSEEWTGDEDEPASPADNRGRLYNVPQRQERPSSPPEPRQGGATGGRSSQGGHEALRKLETFFQHQNGKSAIPEKVAAGRPEEPSLAAGAARPREEAAFLEQEGHRDAQLLDVMILPPPDLYADS